MLREEQLTSSSPVDDEEIMASVLGKRKNYVLGMGYGPRPPRSEGSSSYSQEYVQSLENRLAKTEEWMQTQQLENEKAREHAARTEQLLEMQRQEYEKKFSQMSELIAKFVGGSSSQGKVYSHFKIECIVILIDV